MHHLIIAAHPRVKSFNHAVVQAYTAALAERGHQVACRDLYAIGFNPILSARDMAAISRSKPPIDIRRELHAIAAADAITVIAPLWWGGFPAVLKGYIDRVFTAGSPYLAKNTAYGRSLFGRKGAIITTSEASVDELRSDGTLRALKRHHKGLMEYCGVEVVGQLYLGGVAPTMSRTTSEGHLKTVQRFVRRAFWPATG